MAKFVKGQSGNPKGRPPGTDNGSLMRRLAAVPVIKLKDMPDGFEGSPVEFLQCVYRCNTLPLADRLTAARILLMAGIGATETTITVEFRYHEDALL